MGSIRTLKPEFFRSDSLAKVPIAARLTFAGLWTEADSQGRGLASSRVLKGALWSLDDDISAENVEDHLTMLHDSGHICMYEVDGKRYYQVLQWENHQAAAYRRHESKLPEPDWALLGTFGHTPACRKVLEGKGIEGNKNRTASEMRDAEETALEQEFNECWKHYPRKVSRLDALKAYKASRRRGIDASVLALAVHNYADLVKRKETKEDFILHGSTFFGPNNRWEDYKSPLAPEKTTGPINRSKRDIAVGDVSGYRLAGLHEQADALQEQIDNGDFD